MKHDISLLTGKMQGALQSFLSPGSIVKNSVLQHFRLVNPLMRSVLFSRFESVTSARMEEHGFESTTIADVLKAKGKSADGSWLWCTMDDTVYDAVKSVCIFELYDKSFFSFYFLFLR
jgi:hypothetical protein